MKLSVTKSMLLLNLTALSGIFLLTVISQLMTEKVYDGASYANVNSIPSLNILAEVRKNFSQVVLEAYRYLFSTDSSEKRRLEIAIVTDRGKELAALRSYELNGCLGVTCISNDEDKNLLVQDRKLLDEFSSSLDLMIAESRSGKSSETLLKDMLPNIEEISRRVAVKLDQHVDLNVQLGHQYAEDAAVTKNRALYLMLFLSLIALFGIGMIGRFTTKSILKQLGGEPQVAAEVATRLALGDLTDTIELKSGDETSLMAKIKKLIVAMERVASRADAISKGDLEGSIQVLSEQDRLGKAINNMLQMLRNARAEEERRNWLNTGHSQLSQALTGDYSEQQLADAAISSLGRFVQAGRGVLYTVDHEEAVLELLGSYMYTERSQLGSRFKLGEGAIGQVAREKKAIILTTAANDAAPVTTGTSSVVPLFTYTYPLMRENVLLGVLELASLERFDSTKLQFLEGALDVIASFLFVARQREQIDRLLKLAEQAERDVRVQNEHLQEVNTQMEEQQQQLQQQSEELQLSNSQMEEQQQQLQQQSEELQQTNAQMEEQQRLLEQKNEELLSSQSAIDEKAKQLELSNRYKSEFLANMSHELRTPLNAIILLSKMMADNPDGTLGAAEIKRAEVIHRSGEDLLRLINDVLDLSKVEAGRMDLNVCEISSAALGSELQDLFSSIAQNRGLTFEIEDQLHARFYSDPDKLSQILRNLLSNAFKFTRQGSVRLIFERCPDMQLPIRLRVCDSGIGIPQNKQHTIFEAFRQVDGSTSREFGGTGLGLTISLRLAELLGGTIALHSTEGVGSEFSLSLPEYPPGAVARQVQSESLEKTGVTEQIADDREHLIAGDKLILLIDDDRQFAHEIVLMNRRLGYKTIVAASGEEGLQFVRQYHPAGILLDLGLPDMDGSELLHQIKSDMALSSIPVYVVSAREHNALMAVKGIAGYLQKPVNPQQIEAAEASLLRAVTGFRKGGILIVSADDVSASKISQALQSANIAVPHRILMLQPGTDTLSILPSSEWGMVIIDMSRFSINEGVEIARSTEMWPQPVSLLFYGLDSLNEEDTLRLTRYSDSIIVNSSQSVQRLSENIERFLRTVQPARESGLSVTHPGKRGKCLTGKRILVIDDDPRNLFVVTAALEQDGASVINAVNGRKALDLLQRESVDLIITDMMMPEMDGYQTIAALRAAPAFAKIPVIALTAKAMPQDRQNILEVGANDYLSKPVDYDVLNNMVALWCAKS